MKASCRECGAIVEPHYDHVGDCATGQCSGTYHHPSSRTALVARRCSMRHKTLSHADIRPAS